jgi:23S rRNA (adenine2030-N6)-methyltransferase
MILSESHATEQRILQHLFSDQKHIQVFDADGFTTLKSQLPPAERRGLYLIDPSYELEADYKLVTQAIKDALLRFATGIYVVWYPVVYRRHCEMMHERLSKIDAPLLRIEHCWSADTGTHGMTGAGLFIVNPPWQLADRVNEARNWLNEKLCEPGQGQWRINGDIV